MNLKRKKKRGGGRPPGSLAAENNLFLIHYSPWQISLKGEMHWFSFSAAELLVCVIWKRWSRWRLLPMVVFCNFYFCVRVFKSFVLICNVRSYLVFFFFFLPLCMNMLSFAKPMDLFWRRAHGKTFEKALWGNNFEGDCLNRIEAFRVGRCVFPAPGGASL